MEAKIGQEIEFKESFEVETFSGRKIEVKKGDKGIVIGHKLIKHINGEAVGMIQRLDSLEIKGYDYKNISKMILNRLNSVFNLEEFLIDEDINKEYVIEEIEDLLSDILQ